MCIVGDTDHLSGRKPMTARLAITVMTEQSTRAAKVRKAARKGSG